MATPARPRLSTSTRASSIPTPGRSRSTSHLASDNPDEISRAFVDAVKANDPHQHRTIPLAPSTSTSSLSPQSVSYSGRRSVAGRPSSVASSSSSKIHERVKTPVSSRISSRPPSRQAEISKPNRIFVVGDHVRIESLGFEGVLRYVGEIEGKSGLWAGVELAGGFSGKGKNNGSVEGKQYFLCPNKCGVFVAITKLSAPTVGPGAIQRPPSVASHKAGFNSISANSGRTTPSLSTSTRTPSASYSNGRVTPSSGRITPSLSSGRLTPGSSFAGLSQPRSFKTPSQKPNGSNLSQKITAGSRASKYMTMTAAQLSLRDLTTENSKTTTSNQHSDQPSTSHSLSSSPERPSGSPFSTPKPGNVRSFNGGGISPTFSSSYRGRPSANTPRARIPSGVSMPPPSSPHISQINESYSTMQAASPTESELRKRSSQDNDLPVILPLSFSRPTSATSVRSGGTEELSVLDQLRSRLDAAEYENERLRMAMEAEQDNATSTEQIAQLRSQQQEALHKSSELEDRLSVLQGQLEIRGNEVTTLQTDNQKLLLQLNNLTSQLQLTVTERQSDSDMHSREVRSLQDQVEGFNRIVKEKDEMIAADKSNLEQLLSKFDQSQSSFNEERDELLAQIDELRIAGQETIALYEERLSTTTDQRYELENHITSLEAKLENLSTGQSVLESQPTSSAAQIDNETLKDQVQHLQRKSAKLEEQLEETRATLERDVSAYQEKMTRSRLEDEQRRRELVSKTRELEQLVTSEARARSRVEEIEEALRESTIALEGTRGELEALRAELVNLDVMIDDASGDDLPSKLANFTKKVAEDKRQYQEKIRKVEQKLAESGVNKDTPNLHLSSSTTLNNSQQDNLGLPEQSKDNHERMQRESLVNDLSESSKSLTRIDTAAAEAAGLKHIIQELQKENMLLSQQIKRLEAEKNLLTSEIDQLRREISVLEENLEESLQDEKGLATVSSTELSEKTKDAPQAQVSSGQKTSFEMDLEQMRKRLGEMEIKHARTIHGLNKEIGELEALVEAKIYREDELEQEMEKLKEKLARQKKSSKNGVESNEARHRLSTASSNNGSRKSEEVQVCEICERPGHDIFNCSLLKDDKELICEDCEGTGHVAVDCPHSADVF